MPQRLPASTRLKRIVLEKRSIAPGAGQLPVTRQDQQLDNWCWAAVSSMVSDAYKDVPHVAQCEVAEQVLVQIKAAFCDVPVPEVCDEEARLSDGLKAVGHASKGEEAKPAFDVVRGEIASGRPMAMAMKKAGGQYHFVLLTGYVAHGELVHVIDSWPYTGEVTLPWASFPEHYVYGAGTWGWTYWTK